MNASYLIWKKCTDLDLGLKFDEQISSAIWSKPKNFNYLSGELGTHAFRNKFQ